MKEEEQQIAIAKVCGWENIGWQPRNSFNESTDRALGNNGDWWRLSSENTVCMECDLPDYLNDLNVMREAEKLLSHENAYIYDNILRTLAVKHQAMDGIFGSSGLDYFAPASQRVEAFLRTLNLWTE